MTKSTTINKDPYIYVEKNVLTKHRCESLIKKFEGDSRKSPGAVAGGLDFDTKKSTDLLISHFDDWNKHDTYIHPKLTQVLQNYYDHLNKKLSTACPNHLHGMPPANIKDTGYQIQRTDPGDGYIWHNDFTVSMQDGEQCTRQLTFIFYLNTVDEGWTQFYNGDQISPETGTVVIFPATWTYVHQGYPPLQTKYIMTGWVWTQGCFGV